MERGLKMSIIQTQHYGVPVLCPEDANVVDSFLTLKARKGNTAMLQYKSIIFRLISDANKVALADIVEADLFSFFARLDGEGMKFSTKKVHRARLNTFFKYYERQARRHIPGYYNPVPPLDECNFSPDVEVSIAVEQQREREKAFTPEQLLVVLKQLRVVSFKHFVACVILTVCGMRISECLTIRLENLNLAGRYLMTGIEENARKRGKAYFIFPEEIVPLLTEYVLEVKARNSHAVWLFPGANGHYTMGQFHRLLADLNFPFPVHTHAFRRSLETYQIKGKTQVPLHFVELLSNHAISSIVMRHYAKITIEERRVLYDQYFPPEYKAILTWLKNL